GVTVGEYLRHYRMQLAAIDVLKGKKITDVAFDNGYETLGGFNKAFLKEFGCLPRECRKQAKECRLYYERRKRSMYVLPDRCALLRERTVNLKADMERYCLQRVVYFSLGGAAAAEKGMPAAEIFAAGTANTLDKFTPYIAPGELIVGFNFGDGKYPDFFIPDDSEENRELMRKNSISEEDIEEYYRLGPEFRSLDFTDGRNLCDVSEVKLTKAEREMRDEWASIGRCICHNHSVIGYDQVLKLGFEGLLRKVEEAEKLNGELPMYNGMKNICRSAMRMGEKYALEAERLLCNGDPDYDAEDLKKVIDVCRNVPRRPARTFAEAVQSLWFAHIVNTWEDNVNANSLGRLDQILYPYYKEDIANGRITGDEAFELICCLWLKLYRDYDVQQSCVGGTNPDGTSAVNELSYMMLDATERLDFIRCLSVRFSGATEKEFLRRALEVVGHVQKGIPFFFNDDVMIPALRSKGIAEEDAYNYTQLGCVETVIPGKSNPHAVTGESNLLKAIEYTLENGRSMACPEFEPGVRTGELESFVTYQSFYAAVLKQVDRILDVTCSQVKKYCDACIAPKAYKSLLTEGCLASGRDFNEKGAVYDYYQIMLGGVPNLADSLQVIKKFVYEEKRYSLRQIKEILENNFPDEAVRTEFVNKASKFGNDIDEVDSIAVDIVNHACDELEKLEKKYDRSFHAQPFTFLWMIEHGKTSAASPDGRRKGEPIAYSASPMQGRDFNGLTAVLNSIAKFPTKRTPGTTSAIVEVDPKLFTDRNIGSLVDILTASAKKGLSNVQFNTVDAETLIDAKRHPEKYNNLAVRVSGFSQKFNLLQPELQDHIIGRTKHTCL
ncbi:MAG: pyruvate formate lyase family protein, partial [Christensenellales bacterium]